MLCLCRRCACSIAILLASAALWPAAAGDGFPFGSELMLEAAPMQGSKRVPMLEIEDDGTASIDLWCTSLHAQATITDDSIAIVPGQPANQVDAPPCDPERQSDDAALLAALAGATKWRRSGDAVELSGGTTLHYRLMTN
jgi:META domain